MPSPVERLATPSRRGPAGSFAFWNRKAHYYLGLYFLFFLWLFSFTGLLLNHSWPFAEFWPTRQVTQSESTVPLAGVSSDIDIARRVMQYIGVSGEIEWTSTRAGSSSLDFRATRPGAIWSFHLDPVTGRVAVEKIDVNGWGITRMLHTFTGVRRGDTRNQRDWLLTTIWAISMDALACGLAIMVLGGIYLWLRLPGKRASGLAALTAGTAACGLFLFGLRLLYA